MTIAAARPLQRHQPPPREVALLCARCDSPFLTLEIVYHCFNCGKAARKAFGTPHPRWEISGL